MIPSGIFTKYFEACDEFISNDYIGKNCTSVNETRIDCTNCSENTLDGSVTFTNMCPYCNGNSYLINSVSQNFKLRVYNSPKNWIKVGNVESVPGRIQVIGLLTDKDKLIQSTYILIYTNTIIN